MTGFRAKAEDRDRFWRALRELHDALTAEADRLDHDIPTAKGRGFAALAASLCSLRERMCSLLGRTSRLLTAERDPDDPTSRDARCSICGADDWVRDGSGWHCVPCRDKHHDHDRRIA